jgi:uncharacterized protein
VRDAAKAGALMALGVASGAEEMSGGAMFFDDPEKMLVLARADAIASTQDKAKLYAEKLGLKLGPVVAVTDDPLMLPGLHRERMPVGQGDKASLDGNQPVPIEPGQRVVSKTLYVTWELK